MTWQDGKPILGRLPIESQQYQGNEVVEWLVDPWDRLLVAARDQGVNLYRDYFDPATCKAEAIDWLAQIAGFTGQYWDASWPLDVKRTLIAEAYLRIWPTKGSRDLLDWLIALFELQAQVYLLGDFLAGISVAGDPIGSGEGFQYWIRVPLAYLRTGASWKLVEKLNDLYGPVYCESQVCYDQFYAGFSAAGDPVFDEGIF